MIKPINLFLLSRIEDVQAFRKVLQHDCLDRDALEDGLTVKCQKHEIQSLKKLVDCLVGKGCDIDSWEGFFYNYIIPQIGKEFDLLKITDNKVLNIELKSESVPTEKIERQLQKNRHYLSHLDRPTCCYCVVTDTMTCYKLTERDNVKIVSLEEIAQHIQCCGSNFDKDINALFMPSQFLISPIYQPDEFVNGHYFLTEHQEIIKKDILYNIENNTTHFYCITGKPGTGKTLLLYDVARHLAQKASTLIVHCALHDTTFRLNGKIDNLTVSTAEHFNNVQCKYLLLDECQKLTDDQWNTVLRVAAKNNSTVLFSMDPEMTLARQDCDIYCKVNELKDVRTYNLTNKIRTNKDVAMFIRYIIDVNKKPPKDSDFTNISVCCANSYSDAKKIVGYFKDNGYTFINYLGDNARPINRYGKALDAQHVAGQEFSKILVVLDDNFYYDKEGKLHALCDEQQRALYEKMFYQAITRVKDTLALLVVNNQPLFNTVVDIFHNK